MKRIIFFLLIFLISSQRQSLAESKKPICSFDDQNRLLSYSKSDGTDFFYTYDDENEELKISSSNNSIEHDFSYTDHTCYGKTDRTLLSNSMAVDEPQSSQYIKSEKIPFYVQMQEEIGKRILEVASHFNKVSDTLETLANSTSIPIISDTLFLSSLLLSFAYNPIEETPYIYHLDTLGDIDGPLRLGYLNGMMTIDTDECYYSGNLIHEKTDGKLKLDLFYLPSHGYVLDMLECLILKFGLETPNTIKFREEIRRVLKTLPDNQKYILILHSKASLLAEVALDELTHGEKQKLEIYSFAPATILDNGIASKVSNISSMFDAITLQSPISFLNYFFSNKISYEWLSPIEKVPLFDHRFASETYQVKIKLILDEILENYQLN